MTSFGYFEHKGVVAVFYISCLAWFLAVEDSRRFHGGQIVMKQSVYFLLTDTCNFTIDRSPWCHASNYQTRNWFSMQSATATKSCERNCSYKNKILLHQVTGKIVGSKLLKSKSIRIYCNAADETRVLFHNVYFSLSKQICIWIPSGYGLQSHFQVGNSGRRDVSHRNRSVFVTSSC